MKMSREARLAYLVNRFWSIKGISVINLSRYNKLFKALELERRTNDTEGFWVGSRLVPKKKP